MGGRPARRVLHIFYEDRDAGEEARVFTTADASVDLLGLAARALGVEHRERVELRIGDRFQGRLDGVGGADFAVADSLSE